MRLIRFAGFWIVYFVAIPVDGNSGNLHFSNEFPVRITELHREVPNEQRASFEAAVQRMLNLYETGAVAEETRRAIQHSWEVLTGGRCLLLPDLMNFITILDFILSHQDAERLFESWNAALNSYFQIALPSQISLFIQWSANLFTRNILSSTQSVVWLVSAGNWFYDFTPDGPVVIVKGGTIEGFAGNDSTKISDTTGRFIFNTNIWEGFRGKISWQRAGLHSDSVFVELQSYRIAMAGNGFSADSALLFHHQFAENPLWGRFNERLQQEIATKNPIFPQFQSYDQSLKWENVFPGVHLRGGIQLNGSRVSGTGEAGRPAMLEIFVQDQKALRAYSCKFLLQPGEIYSENTTVSLYLGADSIWHGRVSLRYVHANRELSLIREGQGETGAPFISSFHKIDIRNEAIYWKLDSFEMFFQAMRGVNRPVEVSIISHNYFDKGAFHRIRGISNQHPLSNLATFSRESGTREFYVFEYARFVRRQKNIVRQEMVHLNSLGFVYFFEDEDRIVLSPRLFHALKANAELADHDFIRFSSNATVVARLDVKTRNLYAAGVEKIPLSIFNNVLAFPTDQNVVLKNSLNFEFDGRVESGLLSFYGLDFRFNYQQFKLEMGAIDSLVLRVIQFGYGQEHEPQVVRVANVLSQLNGDLFIDNPTNKSGRLSFPLYPYFTSLSESYVHFSDGFLSTRNFAPGDMYFKLHPFVLENINRIRPKDIGFQGVLVSAGIFPEVTDIITLQEDFTLGFRTATVSEGLPIYGGLGNFEGELMLNQLGLNITGKLNILGAEMTVSELLLFPDRASGVAQNLVMNPETSQGGLSVTAQMADIQIDPFQSSFILQSQKEPIVLYGGQALLTGKLTLNPEKNIANGAISIGNGRLKVEEAELFAEYITYHCSDLQLYNNQGARVVEHFNFSGKIDVESMMAEFDPAGNDAYLRMPGLGLRLRNYSYYWNLHTGSVCMHAISTHGNIAGIMENTLLDLSPTVSEVRFENSNMQPISFHASSAFFDTNIQSFNAADVPYFSVANAAIFPIDHNLVIDSSGRIVPLEGATIIASKQNRFHRFYDARVEILSGNNFNASGFYDFVNNSRSRNPLFFQSISSGSRNGILAEKVFSDSIPLRIHERLVFQGSMQIQSDVQYANFRGFAKILVDCEGFIPEWFSVNQPINPMQMMVRVGTQTRNLAQRPVYTGLMLSMDSLHVYPAFLSRPKSHRDSSITGAIGYLTFNPEWNRFEVTTSEKFSDKLLPHNWVALNVHTCVVETEGNIHFGIDLGRTRPETFGFSRHNPEDHTTEMNLVMSLQFLFSERAMRQLIDTIRSNPFERLTTDTRLMQQFFRTTSESNFADLLAFDAESNGMLSRLPASLSDDNFLFSANMHWDNKSQTFVAGQSLGLIAVSGQQIYKRIPARLEIEIQPRGSDSFTMLLLGQESTPRYLGSNWYYFQKRNNVMAALSSNNEFNEAISRINPSRRRLQPGDGLPSYTYLLAPSIDVVFDFFRTNARVSHAH